MTVKWWIISCWPLLFCFIGGLCVGLIGFPGWTCCHIFVSEAFVCLQGFNLINSPSEWVTVLLWWSVWETFGAELKLFRRSSWAKTQSQLLELLFLESSPLPYVNKIISPQDRDLNRASCHQFLLGIGWQKKSTKMLPERCLRQNQTRPASIFISLCLLMNLKRARGSHNWIKNPSIYRQSISPWQSLSTPTLYVNAKSFCFRYHWSPIHHETLSKLWLSRSGSTWGWLLVSQTPRLPVSRASNSPDMIYCQ